jgi:hypothetical protein
MGKSAETPLSFVSRVSLVGRTDGTVKSLRGFKKTHHTVPDVVNAATSGFLARLCADELADEAEEFFQQAKSGLNYKRAQISLEISSPIAVLTTRDFIFELAYALDETDPAKYGVTRTLHRVRAAELAELAEFDALFASQFSAVAFALKKGVQVEAVIDAVEGLESGDGGTGVALKVDYPSDCRSCTLTVEGVDAAVVCDGATLEMRFARNGSPRELIAAFAEMRRAFALTKNRALTGLLG